jgi:hypothetical protein
MTYYKTKCRTKAFPSKSEKADKSSDAHQLISLGLRPRNMIPRIRTPNRDVIAIKITVWQILFLNYNDHNYYTVHAFIDFSSIYHFAITININLHKNVT